MKKNLGSIIIFLFFITKLSANPYVEYELSANKTTAFIKEPVLITFKVHQIDHTDHMFFILKAKPSSDYEIHLLSKRVDDTKYHDYSAEFQYILFPLKAKKLSVLFDFTLKTASDQAVAQSYVDDHDDSIAIETIDKKIILKPLIITAKKLAQDIDLVGDFSFNAKIDRQQITQYDDINILYTLTGTGYDEANLTLLPALKNVTIFKDVHDVYKKLTKKGYSFKREYTYSLSSKENFKVPAIILKAYSTSKAHIYTLKAPAYDITVKKIDPQTLLDKKEIPAKTSTQFLETVKNFFIYILIFIAGFVTAKFAQLDFKYKKKEKKFTDIQQAKTAKELINVLLQHYSDKNIDNYIAELELLAYKKSKGSLKKIKNEILKEFM